MKSTCSDRRCNDCVQLLKLSSIATGAYVYHPCLFLTTVLGTRFTVEVLEIDKWSSYVAFARKFLCRCTRPLSKVSDASYSQLLKNVAISPESKNVWSSARHVARQSLDCESSKYRVFWNGCIFVAFYQMTKGIFSSSDFVEKRCGAKLDYQFIFQKKHGRDWVSSPNPIADLELLFTFSPSQYRSTQYLIGRVEHRSGQAPFQ